MNYDDQDGFRTVEIVRDLLREYVLELNEDNSNKEVLDEKYKSTIKGFFLINTNEEITYLLTALYIGKEYFLGNDINHQNNKQEIFAKQYRKFAISTYNNIENIKKLILIEETYYIYEYLNAYINKFFHDLK
ncbi:hypothetical protein ACO1B2_08115 [Staphylococcus saprophyticus]|uniref:hypothetical protein n=1 Tax=Staphylococcus TaxID=1279 RepID=UPI000853D6FA|nr:MULTISPECIES: hypothetical protein [Staphylococcus]MCD8911214.1 hypothetical protein [Staphylococcus gallinarum]MDW4341787.1 hypothetical protein [Staphylococcus saprophyticus]OEK47244.1 hypothetical protein ASS92_04070 [Staphylococcus saprophyticus]